MDIDTKDRSLATLGAAGSLVAVVTVVVVVFGIKPYPDVPRLVEQPDPPVTGQLAYLRYDREPCLHVVGGRGEDREIRCGSDVEGGPLVWVDEGHVGLTRYAMGEEFLTIDVVTGEVTSTRPLTPREEPRPLPDGAVERADGARLSVVSRGATASVAVQVPGEAEEMVLELDGPHGYRFDDARWTADGRWIVVRDSAERVIVLGADGEPGPRVWVTGTWEYAVR